MLRMMTSLGSERSSRTNLPAASHPALPQKHTQATADQIRLAQMISDKSDADFEGKITQLMEVTGKNQDECLVALHDCNEDVNRAINFLLESGSDVTSSWETVGKKRGLGKDGSSSEHQESREKRGQREAGRSRRGPSRRSRGGSRSREVRVEQNGVVPGPGADGGAERSRQGRGRGAGGVVRGRVAGGSRSWAQGMGTFNPADYATAAGGQGPHSGTWETGANGTGTWTSSLDECAAEDWNEDLPATKGITGSADPATENHVTPGHSLGSVLQNPSAVGGQNCPEAPYPQALGHSVVLANSHNPLPNGTSFGHAGSAPGHTGSTPSYAGSAPSSKGGALSYAHAALSSVLGSGFGDLSGPKLNPSAGTQILGQLKRPRLGQLTTQPPNTRASAPASAWDRKSLESPCATQLTSQPLSTGVPAQTSALNLKSMGSLSPTSLLSQPPNSGAPTTTSAWDLKPLGSLSSTSLLSQPPITEAPAPTSTWDLKPLGSTSPAPLLSQPLSTGASAPSSTWDLQPLDSSNSAPLLSQFSRDFKMQPEPSLVLGQLTQNPQSTLSQTGPVPLTRQPGPPTNSAPSPLGREPFFSEPLDPSSPHNGHSPSTKLMPPHPTGVEAQGSSQHRQIKPQRRRVPSTSKIPASAVEMPGTGSDISGLNVQFGALDFGSESALQDFGQLESCTTSTREPVVISVPQTQSSLYTKPISESWGVPLSLQLTSPDPTCPSPSASVPSHPSPSVSLSSLVPSLGAPSVGAPSSSSSSSSLRSSFEASVAPHSRLGASRSQDPPSMPMTNGFNGVRSPTALDSASSSTTLKPDSPSLSMGSLAPAPVPTRPLSVPGLGPQRPAASLPPLSSTLSSSNHGSSILSSSSAVMSSSSSLSYSGVDSGRSGSPTASSVSAFLSGVSSLASSGVSSLASSGVSSLASSGVSSLASTGVNSLVSSGVSSLASSGVGSLASSGVSSLASSSGSSSVTVTSGLHGSGGQSGNGAAAPSACRTTPLLSSSGKAPPNLPQGVPPLLPNQYIMGPGGLLPAYPQIYGYEDLHMLQSRLPLEYYGLTIPGSTAALAARDGTALANGAYSGEATKFSRGGSSPPAPPISLSVGHAPQAPQPAQSQAQSQQPLQQQGSPSGQQTFLSPSLPPGYSYPGLPYYPALPGVPSGFQYSPTVFMPPPTSAKQHGGGLPTPQSPFPQPGGYGQHSYSSGYDDLTPAPAGGGYSSSSQNQQPKPASGPGKGVSVASSNSGVPDIGGSVYKMQSFEKQGFHTGALTPFSLPSALGATGPLNPGGAPGYAPAPFLHILPPQQQPHSQLLHHHLTQDGQGAPSQRSQPGSMQQKAQAKSSYGSSPYWGN